ncbi:7-cyano-7-deazaguanine synthase QueC, partial [Simkania negevensis]|nr:7-cyano-7-deazaguanine synthase QueC [Simkania negevensis]
MTKQRAIILLSGGIDSTLLLAIATERERECLCISFDYQQRHIKELESAKAIANYYKAVHKVIRIDSSSFARTSLLATSSEVVPKGEALSPEEIPSTYVPARNTLFLAYAIQQAELFDAHEIFFGPNKDDYNTYPDCRPDFVLRFQHVIDYATKQATTGTSPCLLTPLIEWDKATIIQKGVEYNLPFDLTSSCYDPPLDGSHCGECLACSLRKAAFVLANIPDPTRYK